MRAWARACLPWNTDRDGLVRSPVWLLLKASMPIDVIAVPPQHGPTELPKLWLLLLLLLPPRLLLPLLPPLPPPLLLQWLLPLQWLLLQWLLSLLLLLLR